MLLQNYLHAVPVIWLDPDTGAWRPATDAEVPPGVPLIHVPGILGSYLEEEDGSRFFRYWTDDRSRFFFRVENGPVIEIEASKYAEVRPALDLAGRPLPDLGEFSIHTDQGQLLFRHTYPAAKYYGLYMMDFSFPTAELADWDFFVALKGSFEYMREQQGASVQVPGSTEAD
ncbi:hypothetical protein OOT46_09270 [Aquabacterium sp. A7-Y]|uniref:hypothetical protein n=1 Tax=Aquabacterium sp. A7-Y TaxID=1349605 RepID=UPI00223DAE1B|nr:hypothetical protein [Aquabacterium sp. A7-Y]MCW7538036.1 hypothetical protein [Aquabacterium sp. A7-Y]